MSKKGPQPQFNGFHAPLAERSASPSIPLPGQFETKVSPGGGPYRQKHEYEPLLPDQVPLRQSSNGHRNHRLPGGLTQLTVNPTSCANGDCSQSAMPNEKEFGDNKNIHMAPSPHLSPHSNYPSKPDSPLGASMSDIELAMSDEEGQNTVLLRAPSSHLSAHSNASRCFNIRCSPVDNVKQPNFPVPPKTLDIERCPDDCCDKCDTCPWHYVVFKYPHFIIWQVEVKTIVLKKQYGELFEFSWKAKKLKTKDETCVLVDKVIKNSKAAKCGLAVGDLILSVNGVPFQTLQRVSEINIKRALELKMEIQRPVQILDKAYDVVQNLMKNKPDIQKSKIAEPVSPSTSPNQAQVKDQQPFETIPLHPLKRSDSKSLNLPQARVFLCGNCTLDFIRIMFGNLITEPTDSQAFTFQVSIEKLPDGTVRIGNSKAFSYLPDDSSKSCINVEFIAVLNDSFFHNCCPWMFMPTSIFILTFDTRKLSLSTDAEMAKLSSLAHTILSHYVPKTFENLKLIGLKPPGGDATTVDMEVQILFYTNLAASLPEPNRKIVFLSKSESAAENKAIKNVQEELFSLAVKISQTQPVLTVTTNVIDQLIVNPDFIVSKHELITWLPEWIIKSGNSSDTFSNIINDLKATGNLVEVGKTLPLEDHREFVIPFKFLDCLAKLIQRLEKDQSHWFLSSNLPGLLKEFDLLELLSQVSSNPHKMIAYMKDMNIVYPIRFNNRDSGFCEGSSFVFPFFIENNRFHMEAEDYQEVLLAECTNTIPVSAFFHLLSKLSFLDQCSIASIDCQSVFRIHVDRMEILIHLEKETKRIHVFIHRNQKMSGKQWLREIIQNSISYHSGGAVVCRDQSEAPGRTVTGQAAQAAQEDIREDRQSIGSDEISNLENITALSQQLLLTDEMNGISDQRLQIEQQRLLNIRAEDLRNVPDQLRNLYEHMSIDEKWKIFGAYLGLSQHDIGLYNDIVRKSESLSGYVFYTRYVSSSKCAFDSILKSLLAMSQTDPYCHNLATELWKHAWINYATMSSPQQQK